MYLHSLRLWCSSSSSSSPSFFTPPAATPESEPSPAQRVSEERKLEDRGERKRGKGGKGGSELRLYCTVLYCSYSFILARAKLKLDHVTPYHDWTMGKNNNKFHVFLFSFGGRRRGGGWWSFVVTPVYIHFLFFSPPTPEVFRGVLFYTSWPCRFHFISFQISF